MTAHLFRLRWYTVFFLIGTVGALHLFRRTDTGRTANCGEPLSDSHYPVVVCHDDSVPAVSGSGAWQALARPLRRFSTALFGLPESYFALFLLSQFAGYPVGASMLCTLTKQGVLSKEDASRLLCVCYGGGPAFLLGLLGTVSCRRTCFLLIFSANLFSQSPRSAFCCFTGSRFRRR